MNKTIKNVGLLAILPIFMIALAPDYIGEADAATQFSNGTPNQSFGSAGSPVCGGALCGESTTNAEVEETKASEDTKLKGVPYVEEFGITSLGEGMYKVTFTVYAGNEDLQWELLQVSSDISHKEAPIPNLFADSYTYVPVLIQADDPSTISAELAN